MTPDSLVPPPEARRIVTSDGEEVMWQPKAGVIVHQLRGVLSRPLAEAANDFVRPLVERGEHLCVFDDFELGSGYTRGARECLTEYVVANLAICPEFHILLSAKIGSIGVAAFRAVVGDERVSLYWDRASFLRSYEKAMGE